VKVDSKSVEIDKNDTTLPTPTRMIVARYSLKSDREYASWLNRRKRFEGRLQMRMEILFQLYVMLSLVSAHSLTVFEKWKCHCDARSQRLEPGKDAKP